MSGLQAGGLSRLRRARDVGEEGEARDVRGALVKADEEDRVEAQRIAIFVCALVLLLLVLGCCMEFRRSFAGREEARDDRCEPTGPAARWESE